MPEGLSGFASKQNDASLGARVDFSRSDLKRGREAQIVTRCENILAAAAENVSALHKDYGVSQSKLDGFQDRIDAFRTAQPKPRRSHSSSIAATRQIEDCFGRLDQITNGKLDKLMAQFETSEPAFFEEYWAARKIGQVGSRSSKNKQGVVPLSKAA